MKRLFKNKGFTLIELLVCITILGIIVGMSIPVIRNITTKNSNTKYETYLDTVVNAAKLYVDSYGSDLFGHYETGCNYVTFEELLERNLVKDYNADGITCNTTSTFVEVTKHQDSYSYKGYLGCANKSDPNNLIFTLPNNGTPNQQDPATCAGIDFTNTIGISVEPSSYNLLDKKSLNVKIKLSGRMGIARGNVMFKWATSNTDFSIDGLQPVGFNEFPTDPAQRLEINLGNIITVESTPISTPLGESGKLYLIVYSTELRDLYDNYWTYNDSNYISFGPFNVDNSPPTFESTSRVVSSNASYNNDTPKLALNVTDDLTPASNLKMCVSYNGFCSDWENYNGSKTLPKISSFQYDGSSYPVYVSVIDVAGNVSQMQFNYVSYVHCSQTTGNGEWVGNCPVCGTNVTVTQTRNTKDIHLGTACDAETREHTCNLSACCSSVKTECTDWGEYGACSRACCGGIKKRTRTCTYVSNYNGQDCGAVTDSSLLVQEAVCNEQPCPPFIDMDYGEAVGLISYTCDSHDTYIPTRNCNVVWTSDPNVELSFYTSVYRLPSKGELTFLRYGAWASNLDNPYCVWQPDCGFPVPGVYKSRADQLEYNLTGNIATFNMSEDGDPS